VDKEKGDNPGIPGRVGKLEVEMGGVKADIRWIKGLVAPTFLVSFVSLIIMVVSFLRSIG